MVSCILVFASNSTPSCNCNRRCQNQSVFHSLDVKLQLNSLIDSTTIKSKTCLSVSEAPVSAPVWTLTFKRVLGRRGGGGDVLSCGYDPHRHCHTFFKPVLSLCRSVIISDVCIWIAPHTMALYYKCPRSLSLSRTLTSTSWSTAAQRELPTSTHTSPPVSHRRDVEGTPLRHFDVTKSTQLEFGYVYKLIGGDWQKQKGFYTRFL